MPDVLVVGGGPAGSAAACWLARAGVSVTVVEAAVHPRPKPCGDGLTVRALRQLEALGLGPWLAEAPHLTAVEMTGPAGGRVELTLRDQPRLATVVPRHRLDARLLEQARQAGAQVLEGARARGAERRDGRWVVSLSKDSLQAHLLVAADGARGDFSRRMGWMRGRNLGGAVRGYYRARGELPPSLQVFFLPELVRSYAWIFPLGDGLANVGLGVTAGERRLQRPLEFLEAFAARHGLERVRGDGLPPPAGHPLQTAFGRHSLYGQARLGIGDAVGLVNPLTGEGMGQALESAQLAARVALGALQAGDLGADRLAAYGTALRRRFGREVAFARWLDAGTRSLRLIEWTLGLARRDALLNRGLARGAVDSLDAVFRWGNAWRLVRGMLPGH